MVALEAFLNESTAVAPDYLANPQEPQVVAAFAEFMDDAERSHVSLESKFIMGNWSLTGKRLDRGVQPYQDFSSLVGLRNDLVHFTPNESVDFNVSPDEIHQRLAAKFRSKNILATGVESVLTP